METSDLVNPTYVARNRFITLFLHIIYFLQKLKTLFSSTYISVVIDCVFNNKVTRVKCFNLKYQCTTKHS
jgi:hypothetical protein